MNKKIISSYFITTTNTMKGIGAMAAAVPAGVGKMQAQKFGIGKMEGADDKKAGMKAHESLGKLMMQKK